MGSFILKNGKFILADEKLFQLNELGSLLFSEKIRAVRNNFPFFTETVDLLLLKFRIFNCPVPEILAGNARELKRQMERLLVKNKLYKSTVITISFFLDKEGIDYLLSPEALDLTEFELNRKGLLVNVFDKMQKAVSALSGLSIGSDPLWRIASAHLANSGFDDFLIINSDDKIIEGIAKKLLVVKGNKLIGVSASSGAFMDVAGSLIPVLAQNAGLSYIETDGFTVAELHEADELIFFDSLTGFQWILGFREKRYYCLKARQINDELNKLVLKRE